MIDRSHVTRRSLAILFATALLVTTAATVAAQEASPIASEAPPEASPQPAASLAPADWRPEGTWQATSYDPLGAEVLEPLPTSTLLVLFLPDGRLEGSTACGGFVGGHFVDGSALSIGIFTTGSQSCRPRRADELFGFTQALQSAASWQATAEGLELLDADGRPRVTLVTPGAPALISDWTVSGYANANGRLLTPAEGTELSVAFDAESRLEGDTGCRLVEGPYSLESDRILIGPLEPVGLPCEGDLRRQDRRFRAALEAAILWRVEGDRLQLLDGANTILVDATAVGVQTGPDTEGS